MYLAWLWPVLLGANASTPPQGSLVACMEEIRRSRAARSIAPSTWEAYRSRLTRDERILAEVNSQPEFRLPVWDYMAVMVDQERIDDGRRVMQEHATLFDSLARVYDVRPAIVAAIWGVESNFGRGQGAFDVVQSLATLSCVGRRQNYFRRELLAALRIVQRGQIDGRSFVGSWAGAFGHTQFMPGTYEWLAVDFDGDGRRDVIGSVADALASTANYLKQAGLRASVPWGVEVRLPAGFAGSDTWRQQKRALSRWESVGVRQRDGSSLSSVGPPAMRAGLFFPAGSAGPAFLVTRSFEAVFRYNASQAYSLAIVHLADRIEGGSAFVTPWPTDDLGLSRADRRELQSLLSARGHPIGPPTGLLTPATRAATRAEQARLGFSITGRPGQKLLVTLRTQHP